MVLQGAIYERLCCQWEVARLSKMALLKFVSFIVLTSVLFMPMYPSSSSAEHHGIKVPSPIKFQKAKSSPIKIPKVTLSLYYESLCPYCQAFIKNDLLKLFVEDLIDIVNLRLVPWGNARVLEPNKTIICQVTFWCSSMIIFFNYILLDLCRKECVIISLCLIVFGIY